LEQDINRTETIKVRVQRLSTWYKAYEAWCKWSADSSCWHLCNKRVVNVNVKRSISANLQLYL